jgi:excinuclease ABC subunit C
MKSQQLKKFNIPDVPGVYIFRDSQKRPLYIGRATSLKDRVKSYFGADLIDARGPRIVDMVTKAAGLTWQETGSVLEAVLLESGLIKKYQPFYNVDERDDKSAQYVVITEEEWPRVFLVRARDFECSKKEKTLPYKIKKHFGPFVEIGLIKEAMRILRRLFPFRDKKAHDPRHENFYRALGQSPDRLFAGNTGIGKDSMNGQGELAEEQARKQYLRTIRYLSLFFEGKSGRVRTLIERQMKKYAREMQFEKAAEQRKMLYALNHISDIALIKRNGNGFHGAPKSYRIEAYDVAHLGGTNVVGSMTVSVNGQLTNSEYRKFKISREVVNDLAGLVEILSRRLNHSEWQYPDLIVVDGNEMQLKAAESVLKARRISIPVVAVTKDERHKASRLIGLQELIKAYRDEIIAVNSEAHRFAIRYHRERRGKGVLG